jgi:hypothetical protein
VDKRAELAALADALVAAGVPAALDPRDVTPPAAWLHLGPWTYDTLCGDVADAQVIVDLISPDVGVSDAMGLLDDLEALTVLVLGPPRDPVTPATVQLPDGQTSLPCYRLTYQLEVTE